METHWNSCNVIESGRKSDVTGRERLARLFEELAKDPGLSFPLKPELSRPMT